MALVVRRIVHQHLDRPDALADRADGAAQPGDVRDIAFLEVDAAKSRLLKPGLQGQSAFRIDIHETHLRALRGEMLHESRTYPRGAARDKYAFAFKTRVAGLLSHRVPR